MNNKFKWPDVELTYWTNNFSSFDFTVPALQAVEDIVAKKGNLRNINVNEMIVDFMDFYIEDESAKDILKFCVDRNYNRDWQDNIELESWIESLSADDYENLVYEIVSYMLTYHLEKYYEELLEFYEDEAFGTSFDYRSDLD